MLRVAENVTATQLLKVIAKLYRRVVLVYSVSFSDRFLQ